MAKKPDKPHARFPLYAHASGSWAKKIKGRVHYFGPWSDWKGAEAAYYASEAYLRAGVEPPSAQTTVANLLDEFVGGKHAQLVTGDITETTYKEYVATCEVIDKHFGKHRPVSTLTVADFNALRGALAKGKCKCSSKLRLDNVRRHLALADYRGLRAALAEGKTKYKSKVGMVTVADPAKLKAVIGKPWRELKSLRLVLSKAKCDCKAMLGPVSLKRRLTVARMIFADQPRACRKALKSPPQRLLRAESRKRGPRFYEAAEIRKLVEAADSHLRAMILLGINCGFGPQDCFTLPASAVDLERGWHTFARPKTEVDRRCPLWPETVDALRQVWGSTFALNGRKWDRFVVSEVFGKLCRECGVTNHGFYSLRRTFETVATTADVSQAIIDAIMGHVRNDMASVYRQKVFDEQLRKCTDHVRAWYLGEVVIH